MSELHDWARALGGEVSGGQVRCPGPGHNPKDRSLSVTIGKDGQPVVNSFAGNDWQECKDYVRSNLGFPAFNGNGYAKPRVVDPAPYDPKPRFMPMTEEEIEAEIKIQIAEAAAIRMDQASKGEKPLLAPIKIYTYDEMLAMPEACFVVDGVIVYRGKNLIFGVSNVFKSFHAVDVGCSVSTGRSYHGKAVKKMKTFYAANEGAIGVGRKRIAAWMAYHRIPQAERRNIFLIRDETILPEEASRNNLIAGIRQLVEPGEDFFIIFDIHRGTMNAPDKDDDAADLWIKGAEILIKEGATILSIAHSPYSDATRVRGSSHGWGSWDGRLLCEGDQEKRTSVLKVDRFKDHESSGQWGFTLDEQEVDEHPGEFSLVPRLDGTVKPAKATVKKLTKAADLALSALKYALEERRRHSAGLQPHSSEHKMRHSSAMARIFLHAIDGGQAGHKAKELYPWFRIPFSRWQWENRSNLGYLCLAYLTG